MLEDGGLEVEDVVNIGEAAEVLEALVDVEAREGPEAVVDKLAALNDRSRSRFGVREPAIASMDGWLRPEAPPTW